MGFLADAREWWRQVLGGPRPTELTDFERRRAEHEAALARAREEALPWLGAVTWLRADPSSPPELYALWEAAGVAILTTRTEVALVDANAKQVRLHESVWPAGVLLYREQGRLVLLLEGSGRERPRPPDAPGPGPSGTLVSIDEQLRRVWELPFSERDMWLEPMPLGAVCVKLDFGDNVEPPILRSTHDVLTGRCLDE